MYRAEHDEQSPCTYRGDKYRPSTAVRKIKQMSVKADQWMNKIVPQEVLSTAISFTLTYGQLLQVVVSSVIIFITLLVTIVWLLDDNDIKVVKLADLTDAELEEQWPFLKERAASSDQQATINGQRSTGNDQRASNMDYRGSGVGDIPVCHWVNEEEPLFDYEQDSRWDATLQFFNDLGIAYALFDGAGMIYMIWSNTIILF